MLISVSGTPGTGKTTVCGVLRRKNIEVIDLKALLENLGLYEGYDEKSGSFMVDVDRVRSGLKKWWGGGSGDVILEGHLSYLAPADMVIVLRTDPDIVMERLLKRGYEKAKAAENAEAEAVSSVLSCAMEEESMRLQDDGWEGLPQGAGLVFERDITDHTPEMVAEWIVELITSYKGKELKYISRFRPGNVDWTEVISGWY
ncbi:MAG: adenylate kinase family protein [Thermoplasmatota archaeon]